MRGETQIFSICSCTVTSFHFQRLVDQCSEGFQLSMEDETFVKFRGEQKVRNKYSNTIPTVTIDLNVTAHLHKFTNCIVRNGYGYAFL